MMYDKTMPDGLFTVLLPADECDACLAITTNPERWRSGKCEYHDTMQMALNAREELARAIAGEPTATKMTATALRQSVRSHERRLLALEEQ